VVVLAVLAIPVFSLRLGFSDEGNYPEETSTRQAYDLLAQGFGPGFNGPLVLAADLPDGADEASLEAVTTAVAETPGVAFASPAVLNDPADPAAALWRVIPTTAPQDEATSQLVERLRDDVLPAATEGSGLQVEVTGSVGAQIDFSNYLAGRIPLFFAVVLALSFLLLMAVFRSVLVPLKAAAMNLLSISAAYGVLTAVFQWGWGAELLGLEQGMPVSSWMPILIFAILFGLSMDYEVFLLSRIREHWLADGDASGSVVKGLADTGRVISAAAAIMVAVFLGFATEVDVIVKQLGLGMAVAVLLDATIVRMVLVPATMTLLGRFNWWLPAWLDRALPHLEVEVSDIAGTAGTTTAPVVEPGDDPERDEDRELVSA
jgi:RND superfamily putative drug exporter